ncbi:MAG: FmdE family protein [Candidatus Eisenbacteria bacterium]
MRAREVLCAQPHDLEVLSLAGREPPLSCLTDGLQVATGATLGRGTISVQEGEHIPAAVFIKGPERLRLTLIPALGARIAEEIADLEGRHPGLGAGYWPAVERLALRYWLELDRAAIFEEKKE